MIESTAENYAAYLQTDMAKQLQPIEQSIDEMLTRLDEFESLVTIVQENRGSALGLTGTLTLLTDKKPELDQLCTRVDVLEKLADEVRNVLDSFEEKIQKCEEHFGYTDNNVLRNLFVPKMFKKATDSKSNAAKETFSLNLNEFFIPSTSELEEN